ncbi:MAG: Zn-dependent hydrolase [Anaerolineae bacterium]
MLRINAHRLLQNLESLARVGGTEAGGVSRPALSQADAAGRAWFKARVESAGLTFRADAAGNLSALLPAANPAARTLLAGSHLDTVPNGGRFDGALGVLAALEALQTIKEAGLSLPVHLEAISFTDEEGSVIGMLGSRALTGQLTAAELEQPRLGPEQLSAGLARLNLTRDTLHLARREAGSVAGYVELHIEQGTRLEDAALPIGVVTSIVGIRSFWLSFAGQAAHAGTTPLDKRADALWGAASFVLQARALAEAQFAPGVVNCGQLLVEPGSFNIVPSGARLALEFRHGSEDRLDQMEAALLELAADIAAQHHLSLVAEPVGGCLAAPMHPRMIEAIEQAAATLQLKHTRLLSLAGHDAQILSPFAPSVLFFVPSVGGISHNPQEYTHSADVVNGANVLLHALLILAESTVDLSPSHLFTEM